MKHTILLVEDDALDVISVKRSLKKVDQDYELYIAFNGMEALQLLNGENGSAPLIPDVILLDLNMPKIYGVKFLSNLRSNPALSGQKVFVMSASGEQSDRNATADLGVLGYLIKPLNFNDNNKRSDSTDTFVQFHLCKILNS